MNMYDIFAQDKNILIYRPEFTKVTGSVTSAILLQQIIYRLQDAESFYKFKEPCKHALYKEGDSWIEELGFTIKEFTNALDKLKGLGLVTTKITMERVTYYSLDRDVFNTLFSEIYLNDETVDTKSTKGKIVNAQREDTKMPKGDLDISKNLLTENTSENKETPFIFSPLNTFDKCSLDCKRRAKVEIDGKKYCGQHGRMLLEKFGESEFFPKKDTLDLPDWLNLDAWNKWVKHRKEIKKPLTPTSIEQQLKLLEENKSDHVKIIETSISGGYMGLFPIKSDSKKALRDRCLNEKKRDYTVDPNNPF